MKVYLIGALKCKTIPTLAGILRADGLTVYDDWWSAGEHADSEWRKHEQLRGRSFAEALKGEHAQNVFQFDKKLLDQSDAAVLVMPAGKSAHIELGYMVGRGKRTAVLLTEPDRFDVMYAFADTVVETVEELRTWLHERSLDKSYRLRPLGCNLCGAPRMEHFNLCRGCLVEGTW